MEQWGVFSAPHLLWQGTSIYNGHLRGPVTLTTAAERLAVELSLPVLMTLVCRGWDLTPNLPHFFFSVLTLMFLIILHCIYVYNFHISSIENIFHDRGSLINSNSRRHFTIPSMLYRHENKYMLPLYVSQVNSGVMLPLHISKVNSGAMLLLHWRNAPITYRDWTLSWGTNPRKNLYFSWYGWSRRWTSFSMKMESV